MNTKAYIWSFVLFCQAMLALSQVAIVPHPPTQAIPLGKSVRLICKSSGDGSFLSYQWSCPGGACDVSTSSFDAPRSRIVDEDTLTVNVVSEFDAGEYTCTVIGGDSNQTATYTLDIESGIVLYKQESRAPLVVYSNGSVVTDTDDIDSGFYLVAVACRGKDDQGGVWYAPDGSKVSNDLFDSVIQSNGQLLVWRLSPDTYANGNYKCQVGNQEAILGLYFTSFRDGIKGELFKKVTDLQSIQTSSTSVRISWNKLTRSVIGYIVSFGVKDEESKRENVIVEKRSTTSVELTSLQPGVEYEATVRAFTQNGLISLVSQPIRWILIDSAVSLRANGRVVTRWTETERLVYKCAVNGQSSTSCTSPFSFQEPIDKDTSVTISAWTSNGKKQVGSSNHVVERKCKASVISPIQRAYLADGRVQFRWTASDSVDKFTCQLDNGPAVPCMSGVVYDTNSLYSGKHFVTVNSYCGATFLRKETTKRLFISLSGIPEDPSMCSRLVVGEVEAVYNEDKQRVKVKFGTNIPAKCTCQLPTASKLKTVKNCDLSGTFKNVKAKDLDASATLTVTCTSLSCDDSLQHSVQSQLAYKQKRNPEQ